MYFYDIENIETPIIVKIRKKSNNVNSKKLEEKKLAKKASQNARKAKKAKQARRG